MQLLLLILGIPALVLLFLPYTSSTSPRAAISGSWGYAVALLGWPFFLAIIVFTAQLRLFLKKTFSGTESALYRLLACAAMGTGLVLLALLTWTEGFTKENIGLDLMFGIPFFAAVFLIVFAARLGRERAAIIALKAAWLPNAIMCGIKFWPRSMFSGWEIGAYLAAFTIGLYSIEIIGIVTIAERKATSGL